MKRLVTIIILCVTVGVCRAGAQDFVLPEGVRASSSQLAQIRAYYDTAPLLEKFFILTTPYQTADSLLSDLGDIEKYKLTPPSADKRVVVDSRNGYLLTPTRVLVYWKYGEGEYLIASSRSVDLCCDNFKSYFPEFFSYANHVLTSRSPHDVIITRANEEPQMKWYDIFTFDDLLYVDHVSPFDWYDIDYILPHQKKDIVVRSAGGCGSYKTDYEARYKWNGDGTFTKIGRNDETIGRIIKEKNIVKRPYDTF